MGFLGSLFNKLTGGIKCPACGMPGAQQEGNRIRCLNPLCQNFDAARGGPTAPPSPQPPASQPQSYSPPPSSSTQGFSSRPAGGTLNIWYRNFKGESKSFVAEANSLKRKHNHIIAKVAPKGKAITLARDRIQNMHEIDPLLPGPRSFRCASTDRPRAPGAGLPQKTRHYFAAV